MRRTLALGIAATAIAAATAGGVAFAADSGGSTATPATLTASSAPSGASTGTQGRSGHQRRPLAARALHGTFTVQRKGAPAVVDVQRGQVTHSDPASVTVRSTDGFEATYVVNSSTHIRKDKKPATTSDLPAGTKVAVEADDAGGHPVARVIRVTR